MEIGSLDAPQSLAVLVFAHLEAMFGFLYFHVQWDISTARSSSCISFLSSRPPLGGEPTAN